MSNSYFNRINHDGIITVMKQTKIPKNIFKKYPGKRVAIVEGKVVAVSFDAKVVYEQAKEKYPNKKISIFAVPRREDKYLLV